MEAESSQSHRPPLLQYQPASLPVDALDVLRPSARPIVLTMLVIQVGVTGLLCVITFVDEMTHDRAMGVTMGRTVLVSLALLFTLVPTGVIWWLSVRRLRWAIREEGLIIARGQKIVRSIFWNEITQVDVRPAGVILSVTSRPRIARLSPLRSRDGERVRRAWLERGVRTAT